MTTYSLRDAVRRLIVAHPDIRPSAAGHASYIERYRTGRGANIGLETRGERHQNLFVEVARVDMCRIGDIPHKLYFAADFDTTKPNSNLFHVDAFRTVDIVRFKIADPSEAQRVIAELTR